MKKGITSGSGALSLKMGIKEIIVYIKKNQLKAVLNWFNRAKGKKVIKVY